MTERLTWKEIQEKYSDQWVGLVDIKQKNTSNIESVVVKYTDKTKDGLLVMQIENKIFSCYTTPDHVFQLGIMGY